jgi:hypothetical protein
VLFCVAKNRYKVGVLVRKWPIFHPCPSCFAPPPRETPFADIFETSFADGFNFKVILMDIFVGGKKQTRGATNQLVGKFTINVQ